MRVKLIFLAMAAMLVASLAFLQAAAAQNSFDSDSLFLKISAKEGQSLSKFINIHAKERSTFNLEPEVEGLTLDSEGFSLDAGNSKSVGLVFNSSGMQAGVYGGSIKIVNQEETFYLPVIFEIESGDIFFDGNLDIPIQYGAVARGGNVAAQVKIFDLTSGGTSKGMGPTSINLKYFVYDSMGSVLGSSSEDIVVDGQIQLTKSFAIPKDAAEGQYIFAAVIAYGSSVGTAAQFFSVEGKSSLFIGGWNGDWKAFMIIIIVILLFALVAYMFSYLLKDRESAIAQLRKYNNWELKKQREMLGREEKLLRARGVSKKIIKVEIKKKVKKLRAKHRERVREAKKLSRAGKDDEIKKRLAEWKKAGYNTLPLESKLGMIRQKDMKKMLRKWKGGYQKV